VRPPVLTRQRLYWRGRVLGAHHGRDSTVCEGRGLYR
jgi:hypothetical protein